MCMAEVVLFAVKSGLQTSVCLKATNTMKEPLMLMLEDLPKVTYALWKTQVRPSEPLSLLASSAERSQQISDVLMFVFSLACANQLSLSHDWNIYCEVQFNSLLKCWIKIWIYNRTLFKVSVRSVNSIAQFTNLWSVTWCLSWIRWLPLKGSLSNDNGEGSGNAVYY